MLMEYVTGWNNMATYVTNCMPAASGRLQVLSIAEEKI
jgi:hypothetical protein